MKLFVFCKELREGPSSSQVASLGLGQLASFGLSIYQLFSLPDPAGTWDKGRFGDDERSGSCHNGRETGTCPSCRYHHCQSICLLYSGNRFRYVLWSSPLDVSLPHILCICLARPESLKIECFFKQQPIQGFHA